MIKFFLIVAAFIRRRSAGLLAIDEGPEEADRWRRDPLSHPDIVAMSERELADLPFEPRSVCKM